MGDNSTNTCAICKTPAKQCCAGCKLVYYCNKDHQRKHWKDGHKNQCAPYKVMINEKLGRYMVATRDIKEGEIILKDNPLVIGPNMASNIMCLGCNKRISEIGDSIYRCTKCNWPLCGRRCEDAVLHKEECKIMVENDYRADFDIHENALNSTYSLIVPLRSLLLKKSNPSKYQTLLTLQSHLQTKVSTPLYAMLKANLVPFINVVLKMGMTEEEILTPCAIFDTNAFDVRDSKGLVKVRAIYPTICFVSHECKHNTKHSFTGDNFQMLLMATEEIPKGSLITTSYTQTLWGTLARRAHLKEVKMFDCDCKRCTDPIEFGTYAGAIYCSHCKKKNVEDCPKIISTNPLDQLAVWKCEKCEHTLTGRQVIWGNDAIKKEILQLDKSSPVNLEAFLGKYKEALHPKNYHSLVVKYALSQMYGNTSGYMLSELSDELLQRKIDICHELLEIADVLEPGWSRFRGCLLYDLQAAMVVNAKREFASEKITKEAAQEVLVESIVILQEAANILQSEPDMKEVLQEKLRELSKEVEFD